MWGLPIISNISHDLVNDTKCGMIVEYGNMNQIKQAIVTLRDNLNLRRLCGTNGRKAFLEKYNWDKMEEKLLRTYKALLNNKIDSTE
jgi:glycosyltransferase involved in cell wall biosynthesis